LTLGGFSVSIPALDTNATPGNPSVQNLSLTPATLTLNIASSSTFAGYLQDGGGAAALSLTKVGAGTLYLGGSTSDSYTGTTTVNQGGLLLNKTGGAVAIVGPLVIGSAAGTYVQLLGQGNQIAPTSNVTITGLGALDLNNFNDTVASLTFGGGIVSTGI